MAKIRPDNYIVKSDKYVENAPTPVLTANKGFILGYTNENRSFSQPCIIFDDFTLDSKFVDFPFMVKSSAMKILVLKDEKIDDLIFCYELLNSTKIEVLGHARHYISVVQPTAINIPRYEEQIEIGNYLSKIDNLITLHQCKVFYKKVIFKNEIFNSFEFGNNIAWEQRKLGDYFIERNERSGDGEMISVTINSGIRKFDELNRHDTKPDDLSKYKRVEIGDIAYNSMRMWQGASGYSPYSGILSPAYTVITPKEGVSSRFFAYLIKRPKTIHLFEINSQGLTKDTWNLKFPAFAPIEVKAPVSYEEQVNISRILIQLDNLITLHQCESCKKAGAVQSAFARRNLLKWADSWEQRKLGDIGKARSGVGFPDAEQGGVTGIPFFKVSDMNLGGNENEMTVANNYVTAEQIAVHRWSPITELPAIFFAKVGAAVMLNRKRLCRFPFLLDNNTMAYSLSSTKWDADFAKALFGTVDLTSLVQVGALPSYNAGDVESMEIYLPSLLEQEQIGGFFKQLDNLITLHQRIKIFFTGDYHDKKNK